jgi:hypothetical protein
MRLYGTLLLSLAIPLAVPHAPLIAQPQASPQPAAAATEQFIGSWAW